MACAAAHRCCLLVSAGRKHRRRPARRSARCGGDRARSHSMRHWLMKTEPESFSVEDLAAAPRKTTFWDGVRNFQARNMLRDEIKRGDQVFMYYSSTDVPGIVAVM